MATDTGKPGEPFSRRATSWCFIFGASITALGASAFFESNPRYWPASHPLDVVLIAAGVLAMIPWFVMVARDRSWWRAYRKGRTSRDEYEAYRGHRTGWPRSAGQTTTTPPSR
jgi:hypothetical protein